jgi:rhodanese-related sulfurtransferase
MLKHLFPLAAVLLAAGGITGIAAQPAPEAPRISVADAKKAIDAGKAILVDVRSAMSHQQEHAKGAISMPTSEVAARMSELPKDKQIITYCT